MNVPALLVLTGRPGSGKTTLAHALARAIRCPALCRDEFKEGLVHTVREPLTPNDHVSLNLHVYDTFFQTIELLLRNGITLVAEAAFQHKLWMPKLELLQKIAQIRLIICSVDPVLARTRVIQRGLLDPKREGYHPSGLIQPNSVHTRLPIGLYEPPQLAVPTLTVDTSDGYKPTLEQVVEFAIQRRDKTIDIAPCSTTPAL